ncbi:hypothetical protein P7C70_g1365, partial [Phenoliferia sp. Uapishka_3]
MDSLTTGLSTATPRRSYFAVPTAEPSDELLREEEQDVVDEKALRGMNKNVPPTPSTLAFLTGKSDYMDDRLIPRSALFLSIIVALLVLSVVVILGKDTGMNDHHDDEGKSAHSHSNLATSFPDIHEECHEYYSDAKPMDYSTTYFSSGAHDLSTMEAWEVEQDPSTCETSLTYLLTPEVGREMDGSFSAVAGSEVYETEFDDGEWMSEGESTLVVEFDPQALDPMTLHYHFGHEYQEEFSDPRSSNVWRKKPMFQMSRHGFEEILVPSDETAEVINLARKTLDNATASRGGVYVGAHIRRGDRHPFSWFFHDSYIPLGDFVFAIQKHWERARLTDAWLPSSPLAFIASASATVASELASEFPSGSELLALSSSKEPSINTLASKTEYTQSAFSKLSAEERKTLTRGMMVDFDLLVGGWRMKGERINRGESKRDMEEGRKRPIAVVCTLSSNVCKMAAVALGWDAAFGDPGTTMGRWVNVDGGDDFDWGPTEVP